MARLRGVCYTSTCTCYFLKADYTPVATGITAASLGIFQVQCSAVILATSFGGKEAILSTLSPWLLSAATARSLLPGQPRSSSSSLEEHGRSRHTPALLRPTAAALRGFLGIGQFLPTNTIRPRSALLGHHVCFFSFLQPEDAEPEEPRARSAGEFTLERPGRMAAGAGKGEGCELLTAVQFLLVGQLGPGATKKPLFPAASRGVWQRGSLGAQRGPRTGRGGLCPRIPTLGGIATTHNQLPTWRTQQARSVVIAS